jgi:KipI family sensor histidine kinase inhibitor
MSGSPPPRLHLLGDAALLCELPAPATLVQQQRIWALAAQAREWPGVGEVLPGMNNLTLTFDPTAIELDALMAQVLAAWPKLSAKAVEGRLVEIPVAYGGEHGPDLGDVAAHTGLTPAEVVRRHSAGEYVVYLLGFLPGFAFMGGLRPNWPRPAAPSRARRCPRARSASAASRPASTRWCRRAAGSSSAAPRSRCSTRPPSRPPCCARATACASSSRA